MLKPDVRLPAMTVLKVQLYAAMQEDGVTVAELTKRLGWPADRLLDLNHASKLSEIEAAAVALGRTINATIAG